MLQSFASTAMYLEFLQQTMSRHAKDVRPASLALQIRLQSSCLTHKALAEFIAAILRYTTCKWIYSFMLMPFSQNKSLWASLSWQWIYSELLSTLILYHAFLTIRCAKSKRNLYGISTNYYKWHFASGRKGHFA